MFLTATDKPVKMLGIYPQQQRLVSVPQAVDEEGRCAALLE